MRQKAKIYSNTGVIRGTVRVILLSEAVLSLLSSMLPCPKLSSPTGRNNSLQAAEITADSWKLLILLLTCTSYWYHSWHRNNSWLMLAAEITANLFNLLILQLPAKAADYMWFDMLFVFSMSCIRLPVITVKSFFYNDFSLRYEPFLLFH